MKNISECSTVTVWGGRGGEGVCDYRYMSKKAPLYSRHYGNKTRYLGTYVPSGVFVVPHLMLNMCSIMYMCGAV